MNALTTGAIIAWRGTILGFFLNGLREYRNNRKHKRAARTMISLEVDHNLHLLRDYYTEVAELTISGKTIEMEARQISGESTELPSPVWSHKMWESQMQLLPMALTVDEIRQIHRHHTLLDATTTIRADACEKEPQRKIEKEKAEKGKAWENFGSNLSSRN